MMDKETETALIFAATIIMQQVCSNQRLSKAQRGKMRRYALILKGLAAPKNKPLPKAPKEENT